MVEIVVKKNPGHSSNLSAYSRLVQNVMAPVLELYRGSGTLRYLRFLKDSEWWDIQKLRELQSQKLQALILHAYENVPYYRWLFDKRSMVPADIREPGDLAKIPVLTRKMIWENRVDLKAKNFPARQMITSYTAGSTGEPLRFLSTKNDRMTCGYAAIERNLNRSGYQLGDKIVMIYGTRPAASNLDKWIIPIKNLFKRTLYINAKKLSLETLPSIAAQVHKFKPEYILSYPSALEILAKFIQKNPSSDVQPKAVICTAEQLYGHQRKLFFNVFGCETFSSYSTWEMAGIASECGAHHGLHISIENLVLEVLDDNDNAVIGDSEGRIIITNLNNYAMPFIRYELGDTGVISNEQCPCGRNLPLLAKIGGRATDIVETVDGKRIPVTSLIDIAARIEGIERFQIVQEDIRSIVVKIVPEDKGKNGDHSIIRDEVRLQYGKILGTGTEVRVDFSDSVELTKEGKRRLVISRIRENPEQTGV
jgi:phenylacetate-CoA ligase